MAHESTSAVPTEDDHQTPVLDGCFSCLLAGLASLLDEDDAAPKRSKLVAVDFGKDPKQSLLWYRKVVLWVSFWAPKENTDKNAKNEDLSREVKELDFLATEMLKLMQTWTVEGNPTNPGGAELKIRRWRLEDVGKDLKIKPGLVVPAKPDISVRIRNRTDLVDKDGKKVSPSFKSRYGNDSLKYVPSMSMDFGEYTRADFDNPAPKAQRNVRFFKNQVLHEFGHALGFVHEHFQPDFQNLYFRDKNTSKDDPKARKVVLEAIMDRLKKNSVFRDSSYDTLLSEVLDLPKEVDPNDETKRLDKWAPTVMSKAWKLTAYDKDSVMMYPFGYYENEKGEKTSPLTLILSQPQDKGIAAITGVNIKRAVKLSQQDLIGAAKAYYSDPDRNYARPLKSP